MFFFVLSCFSVIFNKTSEITTKPNSSGTIAIFSKTTKTSSFAIFSESCVTPTNTNKISIINNFTTNTKDSVTTINNVSIAATCQRALTGPEPAGSAGHPQPPLQGGPAGPRGQPATAIRLWLGRGALLDGNHNITDSCNNTAIIIAALL